MLIIAILPYYKKMEPFKLFCYRHGFSELVQVNYRLPFRKALLDEFEMDATCNSCLAFNETKGFYGGKEYV